MGNSDASSFATTASHSFLTDEKSALLVYGCIRSENEIYKLHIPDSIIDLVVLWYTDTFQILQFSDEFCDRKAFRFEDDRKLIVRQPESIDRGHRFIVADIEPLMEGIHCFRSQVFAICRKHLAESMFNSDNDQT